MGDWWTGGPGGAKGDRTIEQQLTGLRELWPRVAGKWVLDVGSAEGAISLECCRKGATYVEGWERRKDAVEWARRQAQAADLPARFHEVDVDGATHGTRRFDVILLLAILHKLKRPEAAFAAVLDRHAEPTCLVVLRTRAADWPVMRDVRSDHRKVDLHRIIYARGFTLVHEDKGPKVDGQPAEWVGLLERSAPA